MSNFAIRESVDCDLLDPRLCGINRVDWDMRVAPPMVPPAAQVAQATVIGAGVPPGRGRI